MAHIEEAIYSRLTADADVTALVSNRIYPGEITEGKEQPSVSFVFSMLPLEQTSNESSTAVAADIHFDVWAKTVLEAMAVSLKLKASLDAFKGVILGVDIHGILFLGLDRIQEADSELERVGVDFRVFYSL